MDGLKGGKLSGFLCVILPEAWQSARFAHLIVQFQMEIVLAKLEYEDTGFSPTTIERVNSKKNRMKLKVTLINVS